MSSKNTTKQTRAKIRKTKLINFEAKDIIFLSLCFAAIILCAVTLHQRLNKKIIAVGEEIGVLIIKRNVTQRKQNKEVFWENVKDSYPLYNRDTIRTGNNSSALIKLKDGTQLDLEENTLIVVDFLPNAAGSSIDVGQGSLRARRALPSDGKEGTAGVAGVAAGQASGAQAGVVSTLQIRASGQTINVGNADIHLQQKQGQKSVNLTVNRGKLKIASASGGTKTLGTNQKLNIDASGRLKIRDLYFILQQPQDGSRFVTNRKKSPLSFSWQKASKKKQSPGGPVLQISKKSNFSRVIHQFALTEKNNSLKTNVSHGLYFWRIAYLPSQSRSYKGLSAIYGFTILKSEEVRLESPPNKHIISFFENEPLVNLSWSNNPFAYSYDVEIAKDRKFKQVVVKKTVQGSSTSLILGEGSYYWRVRVKSFIKKAEKLSNTRSFSVQRTAKKDLKIELIDANKGDIWRGFLPIGVLFSWIENPAFKIMRFEMARSPDFTKPLLQGISKTNYYIVKEKLRPGKYYWRVSGRSPRISLSPIGTVNISRTFQANLKLLKPEQKSLIIIKSNQDKELFFHWQGKESADLFYSQTGKKQSFTQLSNCKSQMMRNLKV